MYLKIKDPQLSTVKINLFAMGLVACTLIAIGLLFLVAVKGDISLLWRTTMDILADLFRGIRQEEGLLAGGLVVLGLKLFIFLVLPLNFILTAYYLGKYYKTFNKKTAVYALHFTDDGVIIHTEKEKTFLPYTETSLSIEGKVGITNGKYGDFAVLQTLTFTFLKDNFSLEVPHKHSSNKKLYQLVDLHSRFKKFSFHINTACPYSTVQKEMADFLNEQIKNQYLYGLHLHSQQPFSSLIFVALLLLFAGGFMGCTLLSVLFPHNDFAPVTYAVVMCTVALFALAIIVFYIAVKDLFTARKLKRIHNDKC